jgi:predicted deacylase
MSMYIIPGEKQLTSEFRFMKKSRFNGIPGVYHIDSGKPGPVVGISIMTHGNEPSGLEALWHLRNFVDLQQELRKGQVFFVLNNIQAAEKYFRLLKRPESKAREEAMGEVRFCDHNMNRLPADALSLKKDERYEIQRARELRPVWKRFTHALDVHSTSKKSDPMIIVCGGIHKKLIQGFPINIIINNIENIQIEKPAINFYGKKGKIKTVGIEVGQHEDPGSVVCAVDCIAVFLKNMGLIKSKLRRRKNRTMKYREYFINGSVLFPNESFELVKPFEMFEPISKGQVLAFGHGTKIVAASRGHCLLGPKGTKAKSIKEEVMFLSAPMRTVRI